MMPASNSHWQTPINNQLTTQELAMAQNAILKLRVHDLQAIISTLGIRKPRQSKADHQKAVQDALYTSLGRKIFQMLQTPPLSNGIFEMQKRPSSSQVRSHPYALPRNGTSNLLVNHQFQQHPPHHHNLLHQHQIVAHQNQLHQQSPTVRWLTTEMLEEQLKDSMRRSGAPLHSSSLLKYGQSPCNRQLSENTDRPKKLHADLFETVPLPFYDVVATLLRPVELHASDSVSAKQSKTLQFQFTLNSDQYSKTSYRPEVTPLPRYEVQLRFFNITEPVQGPQKDDFPLNCFARVDDSVVSLPNIIPTNKPNAEPKRPSRPVNITSCLRRYKQRDHTLHVEWFSDKRVWAAGIYFVHRINSDILFQRLEQDGTKHRSIEVTRQEITNKLSGGEDDIAMDRLNISLLDPLSKIRMKTPVRCQDCTHLQCFDLISYLMMNEKKPTWQCPVCPSYCPYDRLIVDDYFLDMLSKVNKNTTEVELKKDGTYDIIKENESVCLSDDDDEMKLVSGPAPSTCNGASEPNGGKKKKTTVDDDIITLSDDEDEDLSRGIQNSLNDNNPANSQPAPAEASQKTIPPKKNSKNNDIEVITLDDTPPRPAAISSLPIRQVSQQHQLNQITDPSQSGMIQSSPMSNGTGGIITLNDALSKIGQPSHPSQMSPLLPPQHQLPPHSASYSLPGFMNMCPSGSQTPTSQYGYSMTQQPPHYQIQNGLIGRNNQMSQLQRQQNPQSPPSLISPQAFYAPTQMSNGPFYYPQSQYQHQPYRPN